MLHDVGKQGIGKVIKRLLAQSYDLRSIKCVNRENKEAQEQKLKTRTGTIIVSGLSHKREKQVIPGFPGLCSIIYIACKVISRTKKK